MFAYWGLIRYRSIIRIDEVKGSVIRRKTRIMFHYVVEKVIRHYPVPELNTFTKPAMNHSIRDIENSWKIRPVFFYVCKANQQRG